MNNYITYQLFIELSESLRLTIGKLGVFDFPAGLYVYTGSAKTNMDARIQRHLTKNKKLKWHIDYLLNARSASVTKVARFVDTECLVNQKSAGVCLVAKFAASDCQAGCISHLKYLA